MILCYFRRWTLRGSTLLLRTSSSCPPSCSHWVKPLIYSALFKMASSLKFRLKACSAVPFCSLCIKLSDDTRDNATLCLKLLLLVRGVRVLWLTSDVKIPRLIDSLFIECLSNRLMASNQDFSYMCTHRTWWLLTNRLPWMCGYIMGPKFQIRMQRVTTGPNILAK